MMPSCTHHLLHAGSVEASERCVCYEGTGPLRDCDCCSETEIETETETETEGGEEGWRGGRQGGRGETDVTHC